MLAFVSKPGYDPNLFVDGIDAASWQELNESPDKPLLNRALRGAYPPGSTIKPFLALGALTSGKRTTTQAFNDPGYFQLAGSSHRFRDDKKGGHGVVDMMKSIVVSCDTYYYLLANDTDIDDTHRFMSTLGFGRTTGIDIEGELAGVLPSREWKRQRFSGKNYRDDHRKWYLGDSISAGIGQGYTTFTPVQLAHAMATVANDGVAFRPHLVKSIEDARTSERRVLVRESAYSLAVKPEHLAFIRQALVQVNKEGTSANAFKGAAYTSGGKTGTAQVFSLKGEEYKEHKVDERLRDHAWYIGLRAGGQADDRDRGAGGERRLRRAGRGADRAPGVRLLPARPEGARTGARVRVARGGGRRCVRLTSPPSRWARSPPACGRCSSAASTCRCSRSSWRRSPSASSRSSPPPTRASGG